MSNVSNVSDVSNFSTIYNYGIIICLKDSKNILTLSNRTNKLLNNYLIQYETKHPYNSTIGCYTAHVKALKNAIEIMEKNNYYEYIIIAEEDIEIDYNSKHYTNIIKSLYKYNKNSNYILHLGGFPSFNKSYNLLNDDKLTINSRTYLTTCYVVNIKIAKKLINALENSCHHIHCDAIIANSGVQQRLVRGNIVNQICYYESNNTYLHNFASTKFITYIFLFVYKFRILFIHNKFLQIILVIYSIYYKLRIIYLSEMFLIINNVLRENLIDKKYNKFLHKNIFTFIEILYLVRIFTLAGICNTFITSITFTW